MRGTVAKRLRKQIYGNTGGNAHRGGRVYRRDASGAIVDYGPRGKYKVLKKGYKIKFKWAREG
jgi:hypothetical protein